MLLLFALFFIFLLLARSLLLHPLSEGLFSLQVHVLHDSWISLYQVAIFFMEAVGRELAIVLLHVKLVDVELFLFLKHSFDVGLDLLSALYQVFLPVLHVLQILPLGFDFLACVIQQFALEDIGVEVFPLLLLNVV